MFLDGKYPDRPPKNSAEYATVILLGVLFLGMMGVALFREFTPYKLSVPFFILSWPLLLVIHEFGHALMAKALGWRVELVSIGTGQVLSTRQIFGMKTEFRSIPLSGFAMPRPNDLIQPQFKNFLIYAAGPGSGALLVGVFWMLLGGNQLLSRSESIPLIACQSFCAAATLITITNLIPLPISDGGRVSWSDGLGMILSWSLPTSHFQELIESKRMK